VTDLLLVVLIVIAIVLAGAVIALAVLAAKRRSDRARIAPPAGPRDPFADVGEVAGDPRALKAGDMIDYLGRQIFVRGTLRLKEGGYQWAEHFLDDLNDTEGSRTWLSVEEDPDLELVMWTTLHDSELVPTNKVITLPDGVEYRRVEHGIADFRSEGTTGLPGTGRMEYADYEAGRGRYLAFERFLSGEGGERWEASVGERVPLGTMTIYPATAGAAGDSV
jgi:hypothetical protein